MELDNRKIILEMPAQDDRRDVKPARNDRLDLIKAISISLVLIWHLGPIQVTVEETSSAFVKMISFLLGQLYFSFTLVAVPLFILTSLFLAFRKLETSGLTYLVKRCKRLLEIFAVWSCIQFAVYYLAAFIQAIVLKTTFSWYISGFSLRGFLMGIHPRLPLVGDSVFYFILILLESLILYYGLFFWKFRRFKLSVSISIVVFSLLYFEGLTLLGGGLSYLRPDNFFIYVPIAYFLAKRGGNLPAILIKAFYALFFLFMLQDAILKWMNYDIGFYSRVSIVFGAIAIFSSCLKLENYQASEKVKFLARYSLGIFAIHKYFLLLSTAVILGLVQLLGPSVGTVLKHSLVNIPTFLIALTTVVLTFVSVKVLARTPFQKFIG